MVIRSHDAALTPLAVSALALLVERPMHPYEMYQLMLTRREDRVVKVSAGSLYRAVERLEVEGRIAAAAVEREGNRPERTVYAITDSGRAALRASVARMLRTYVNEFPEFPVAISEAHHLPAAEVAALLMERRESIAEGIAFLDAADAAVAAKAVPRQYVLDLDYTRTMLLAEDAWIARTVDELRSGSLEWAGPSAPPSELPPEPSVLRDAGRTRPVKGTPLPCRPNVDPGPPSGRWSSGSS